MQKVSILHLITAAKNASPFDVNMAFDAGFDKITPYTHVELVEVEALTQDAMFSRSPSGIKREALFFGGRDIHLALDMQNAAKNAMFTPFEMSTMADPSGAFTTAAAIMAKIDAQLKLMNETLAQQTIAIFGASGAVGSTVALIAATQNTSVQLVAHKDMASMQAYANTLQARYDVKLQVVDGTNDVKKAVILAKASAAICAASAGLRVLKMADFMQSTSLKIMVDVNAVAPSGIEGVEPMSDGNQIAGSAILGIGALAIGQLKYKTQQHMLQQMLAAKAPQHLNYQHAFAVARSLV